MRSISQLGYQVSGLVNGAKGYVPNNGFPNNYGVPPSAEVLTFTFSAAPNDNDTLDIPDWQGNTDTPTRTFTFVYGGSPGAGTIPLVGGGGTAAQAATAAQVALSAQLNYWTVTNPSDGVLVLTWKSKGFNLSDTAITAILTGAHNITLDETLASPAEVVPGSFGKTFATLPA